MKLKFLYSLFTTTLLIVLFFNITVSCLKNHKLYPDEGEELSGGAAATVFNTSDDAFGFPAGGLEGTQELEFFTGNSFFNQSWVSAPASTTSRDGLGPLFNEVACSGCHFKDGRGRTPKFYGERGNGFLIRLSIPGSNANGSPLEEPNYGGQLNNNSVLGILREGEVSITYSYIQGTYADGTTYELRKPTYEFLDLNYGSMASNFMFSPRVANQVIGLGLLEAIPEADLLKLVDEHDRNQDGISGRVNYVYDAATGTTKMGRFGWKASQPTVRQQVASAFNGDLGITSVLFPYENCSPHQNSCQQAPNGNNTNGYELDSMVLDRVELYSATLAVPARRNWKNQDVLRGKQLFIDLGCAACHTPSHVTGSSKFTPLANQKIYPYTDLLLHDMGVDLADNRPDYQATGQEWRTPPLWGIGLIETVNGHTELLHDGRARNIEEAILWHAGEAKTSKDHFIKLHEEERQQLIEFLKSL